MLWVKNAKSFGYNWHTCRRYIYHRKTTSLTTDTRLWPSNCTPRRKHLRGPDLDYTHPNTGQESQAKTVPSATAEKIQGLTNNPENFLCRDHRKCFVSVHLSVVWKQLQPRLQSLAESCALSWAYLWVGSPLSAGHLHQTMQRQSWQNHQRLKSPW